MEPQTIGREYNMGKIAKITCVDDDKLGNIDIRDKSFLLLIITQGIATFKVGGQQFTATAPCFVCFDETDNPELIRKTRARIRSIYFHPQFLNINMTFELIRSNFYGDIAHTHDMFLLKPFMDSNRVIPIIAGYQDKVRQTYECMNDELDSQTDWYWSCRARSYFMELIIMLERLYGMLVRGEFIIGEGNSLSTENERIRKALLYIESHYSENITLRDVVKACETNHTTLGELFAEEISMTPMEYLWAYRMKIARKQLEFTEVPLKEVVYLCGFKTSSHFSRAFKDHTGKTPAQFRKDAVSERIRNFA